MKFIHKFTIFLSVIRGMMVVKSFTDPEITAATNHESDNMLFLFFQSYSTQLIYHRSAENCTYLLNGC